MHDAQRSGMFHLGAAGGRAFSGHLPGIKSEALFDDISDAAEKRDLDQVGRIWRTVAARLRSDHPPDEPSPGKGGLDWAAGFLQMLAVLNEARTAREEGDAVRYSLMAGFLVGLMSKESVRYRHGSLKDAVLAAHDRNPESARSWVKAESIMEQERQGESAGKDPRALLLQWMGARLAAAAMRPGRPVLGRPKDVCLASSRGMKRIESIAQASWVISPTRASAIRKSREERESEDS